MLAICCKNKFLSKYFHKAEKQWEMRGCKNQFLSNIFIWPKSNGEMESLNTATRITVFPLSLSTGNI